MRIATWNLERPSLQSWKRLPRQRERMANLDADLWVLTETRASISPDDGYHGLHVPPHPTRRPDEDERWVSLWSRRPLRPTELPPDPRGAVSAIVDHPTGPIVLYGTVLPWANDRGDDGKAPAWQTHYAAIEAQGEQWRQLRSLYPQAPMIVAGDFNQDRDGSGWYGTERGRDLLTGALDSADLVCTTAEDVVATGKLQRSHLVDHIAISRDWAECSEVTLQCWETTDADGIRLSDHPTVAIDLEPADSSTARRNDRAETRTSRPGPTA
jgi:endonuclease/exonuclease/phosphatase family metal-dependent hydrolase